jgi:hypothetical protein
LRRGKSKVRREKREMEGGKEKLGRTEDLPALTEALAVVGVDDVRDGVAVAIVPRPDAAYALLAAEIPELEDGGWKGDRSHYRG